MSLERLQNGVCDGANATPEEIAHMDARWPRVPGKVQWTTTAASRGLGDLIKKATDFVGIPQCGGCAKRQEWLNTHVPFGTQLRKDP